MQKAFESHENLAPAYLENKGVEIVRLSKGCWGSAVNGTRLEDSLSKHDAIQKARETITPAQQSPRP